ncbi:MAG TPA: NAD+ synthase [Acidimicrobiales bacterium]|nr:NAD+ synthase [Acidimicrobiales bacterium]
MTRLRLAACQINTVVGDLEGNASRILAALATAEESGADLAVFPELTVTGYPPEDLLSRPAFVAENLAAFDRIAEATRTCVAVIGFVDADTDGHLVNAAGVCANGAVLGRYGKRLLPNYGVFDEQRWFTPGAEPLTTHLVAGVPVGVTVCEDIWFPGGPAVSQAEAGARLIVNLNASPYSQGRRAERLAMLAERVAETGCTIAYVNQIGGQDELVFDGASVVMSADGELLGAAAQFREELLLVDLEVDGDGSTPQPVRSLAPPLEPDAEVYEALVLGTRDYVDKNGFSDAVIGLSGGIDSSLVATIAVDALGSDNVHGVTMPSRYSSGGSVDDAVTLAAHLGIDIATAPIEDAHRTLASVLSPLLGAEPEGLTDENLQSRIRGVLLMALSNANDWIVLTTGNKSEMATGYSTLYGDSAGGFAVIKDVEKTLVYRLCRYRNQREGFDLIPEPVLAKAPSAELRPDQRDDESLPAYEVLDPILAGYVEGDRSPEELVAAGFDRRAVEQVVRLVDRAEYKRRQMPPGVRISRKAFGKDRRMPITNQYRSGATRV